MIIVQENSTRMLVEQVNECTANIIITSPVVISGGGGNVDSVNNVLPDANKNVTIDIGDIATLQDQLNAKITKVVSKLNFDGQNILLNCPENVYNVYKLSAAITCAITPNEITKGAVLFLQGNGSALHIPTFTNAEQDGDEQFITTNNYVNPVIFWYRGDKVIYRIMSGYVMDNEAMTLSSVSISAITQIAATFNYVADKIGSIVWGVYSAPESQPAKSEILAGTNASDFGTKVVSGAGVGTIAIDTLTYLTEYTIFYYTISENSIESDVAFTNFQTIDLTAMPAPVLSITALDAYSLRATLNQNINGVDLYRGATTGGETFLKTLSAGILTDDTTGLQPNDTRFFIALAKGDGITTKDSIMSTEYSGTTSELPRLATPVVTATPNGQMQIDISCVQITGNQGYNIYGSNTENGAFILLNVNIVNDNTYSETGLTAGQTRWYKYEAIANPATNRNSLLSSAVGATTGSISLRSNGTSDYIKTGFNFAGLLDTDTLEFEVSGNDLKPSVTTSYLSGSLNNATPVQRLIYLYLSATNSIGNQVTSSSGNIIITGASVSVIEITSIKIDANKTSPNKLTIFINGSQYAQGTIGNMSEFNGAPELFLYAYNKIGTSAIIGGFSDISVNNLKIIKNNVEVVNLVANQAGYFDETVSGTIKYNRGLTVNTYPLTAV